MKDGIQETALKEGGTGVVMEILFVFFIQRLVHIAKETGDMHSIEIAFCFGRQAVTILTTTCIHVGLGTPIRVFAYQRYKGLKQTLYMHPIVSPDMHLGQLGLDPLNVDFGGSDTVK